MAKDYIAIMAISQEEKRRYAKKEMLDNRQIFNMWIICEHKANYGGRPIDLEKFYKSAERV
jgi:hypothetical protein